MPNLKSDLKLTGHVTVEINGEVVQEIPNLVVTAGKEHVVSRLNDASDSVMTHMAVGTGSTAAAAGDTTLGTESARVALTSSTVSGATITYVATFPAGTPNTLTALNEAGIFNASSGGTMFCRTVFAGVVNKDTSDAMSITWAITAS